MALGTVTRRQGIRSGFVPTQPRNVEFLQRNSDRREIYALLTADDGQRIAAGPLTATEVDPVYFGSAPAGIRSPSEQAERAAEIACTRDEFHDLADFYHFYGYPADLIEWIERVPAEP